MSKWKEVLGQLAPTAATLLGGPFAGLAVKTIADAMGLSGATVETLQTALAKGDLTGDQIIALKQAELDLQKHLADNGIKLEEITAEDRDSARKREMALKDNTPKVLAYSVTVGFFGVLTTMLFDTITGPGHDVLLVMIGSLGTAWTGIIAYYFGSSAGSAKKTDIISAQGKV